MPILVYNHRSRIDTYVPGTTSISGNKAKLVEVAEFEPPPLIPDYKVISVDDRQVTITAAFYPCRYAEISGGTEVQDFGVA